MSDDALRYGSAGVDLDASNAAKNRIKTLVESTFFAPAYPLENVFDPTGAGDAFAGGFIGYLAATDDLSEANMRRAVIFGSVMGSFAVEKFSIERLMTVTRPEIDQRMREMRRLVAFEEELPA